MGMTMTAGGDDDDYYGIVYTSAGIYRSNMMVVSE